MNTIASGKVKNLKHATSDLSADELHAKRLHDLRLKRMRAYAIRQYEERAQRNRQQRSESDTMFPLRVQAQKDAIREAVAKLRKQKEKTR